VLPIDSSSEGARPLGRFSVGVREVLEGSYAVCVVKIKAA